MVPRFIYGTAWKEEATEALVVGALAAGFRAIDTANQRKHYCEEAVGRGFARSGLAREDVWLQSKFTHRAGQDARLPYDPRASMTEQVEQSFASTLAHFGTTWMDAMLLHGPSARDGWVAEDREVWRALEGLVARGAVREIGVSNVSAAQLRELAGFAHVRPAWVQDRCYAARGWNRDVRAVCADVGIKYQGFSLLTANRDAVHAAPVRAAAKRLGATGAQVIFAWCARVGIVPLTGTSSPQHLREDLAALELALTEEEVVAIERCAG